MKKIISIVLIALLTISLAACGTPKSVRLTPEQKAKLKTIESDVIYDFYFNVLEHTIGVSKNVFVAKVLEEMETVYFDEYTPYTWYRVEIIDNIKGTVNLGETRVLNAGGVSANREYIKTYPHQTIKEGRTYLFASDGIINEEDYIFKGFLLSGVSWAIDENNPEALDKYIAAYQNEAPYRENVQIKPPANIIVDKDGKGVQTQ